MEDEKENVGAEVTTEITGADKATETRKTFEELLQDKDYQSAYDKKLSQALDTARKNEREKIAQELEAKKAEADKLAKMDEDQKKSYEIEQEKARADKAESELNAYRLKDETVRQASQRGVSLELINTIDFSKETAESINSKLDIFEKTIKAEREKATSEYSKEIPPQTGDRVSQKDISKMSYDELADYFTKHPEINI